MVLPGEIIIRSKISYLLVGHLENREKHKGDLIDLGKTHTHTHLSIKKLSITDFQTERSQNHDVCLPMHPWYMQRTPFHMEDPFPDVSYLSFRSLL